MTHFKLQELNCTLSVADFNPTVFNLNTLQAKGIISYGWHLIEEPFYSDRGIKLVFTNQVRIIAQPNKIIFAETIGKKRIQDILLNKTIHNTIRAFSNIDYQAVSLNPSGYAAFDSEGETCQYMSQSLLSANLWQKFQGHEISGVGLKLAYPHKSGMFYLDINQANVEIGGKETPAVWFAGNFSDRIIGRNIEQRKSYLQTILNEVDTNLRDFSNFIEDRFLAVSLLPSVNLFPL